MNDELPGFENYTFRMPSTACGIEKDARLALAFFLGWAARFGNDLMEHEIAPSAIDLDLVRSGRCPLLAEHQPALQALLGSVVSAEIEGPMLHRLVRFCRGPEPDRLWALLADGFPLRNGLSPRCSWPRASRSSRSCLLRTSSPWR